MRRTLRVLLTVFICCAILTGCWSRRELNDLSIAFAIGLDYADGEHVVTVQIINPKSISPSQDEGGGSHAPVATYQTKEATLFEAMRRMTKIVPRKVYLAYVRIVVIGEALAKRGIVDSIDFLLRENEFRTDFYLLVAKNSRADETLKVLTTLNEIPAEKVFDSLEMSERYWAATGTIAIDELITNLIEEGQETVLTGIEIVGDKAVAPTKENVEKIAGNTYLKLTDLAAFRKDKLVGWLNETESKGFNYSQSDVNSTIINIPCPRGGSLALEVLRSDGDVHASFINGQPRGRISVHVVGNIGDVECDIDISKQESINTLERRAKQKIREAIVGSLHRAQKELRTDIFGFGEALHHSDPRGWHSMRHEWEDLFTDLPVDVTVDVNLRDQGTMSQTIQEMIKEER